MDIAPDSKKEKKGRGPIVTSELKNWAAEVDRTFESLKYPVISRAKEIEELVTRNDEVVVIGHTGSGKSTTIPLMLAQKLITEAEEGVQIGKIAVTQPRQLSASSVATRVAELSGSPVGGMVGYRYKGVNRTAPDTLIEFQTDGLLLSEIKRDPILSNYSYIMVDEAHERSINIDLLLGLLKRANEQRKKEGIAPLKIIAASATIDKDKFSKYFTSDDSSEKPLHHNVIEVEGKLHPVEVKYSSDAATNDDYTQLAALELQKSIHEDEKGDVLIFMPTKNSINSTIENVTKMLKDSSQLDDFVILPLYAQLTDEEKNKIHNKYPGKRKIIVATNIAETSITIDGIGVVIDSGRINQKRYDPNTGLEILEDTFHSMAGIMQRTGRAGRTMAGVCRRLFTEYQLEFPDSRNRNVKREINTSPEIERLDISGPILSLFALDVENVFPKSSSNPSGFDYLSPPPIANIEESIEMLESLGLIANGKITSDGIEASKYSITPRYAKLILESKKYNCLYEGIVLASFMAENMLFLNTSKLEPYQISNLSKLRGSDLISTYLNIYEEVTKLLSSKIASDEDVADSDTQNRRESLNEWCHRHGINYKTLMRIKQNIKDISRESQSAVKKSDLDRDTTAKYLQLVLAETYGDFLSYCEGRNRYSFSKRLSGNKIYPDKSGYIPESFFIYSNVYSPNSEIMFLQNVLNLSPEVVLQAYPERIDKKSSIALNWQGKFERTVTSSISINNRDFTISSKTEVLDTLEASDWETYLRSQYSYDLSSVVDSIKSITSQVVVLNPKLKLTEEVRSLNLDNALTAFCVELSKDPEIMREMENSRYSTSSLFKSKFTNFLQKNNPDLASLIVEHKKLTEEKTISINGESSNLSFKPKIKNDSLVYEVQGNLMDIAKNYYSLLSEAGDVPLYIGDNPINSQLRDFFSTEPRSGYYSYSNSGTRLINVFTPTSSDIEQVNSIPEDSFDFAELETGITNPFTKKKVKIYAIKMSDEYLSRRFPVGKIIDGIFYTQSLSEIQDVQSYLEEQHAVNFERIKVRKEAQKLLDVVSDESISALIAKYRDLPGFTPEVEVKLRDMSRFSFSLQSIISSIDNGYMYGEIDMELKSKINNFLEYINFIEQNLHKTPEELQAYYLEEVNKLIEKHYSRCPIHPEVFFSENGYICNKNHKQNMSYLQRSDQPNSNVVVSRIALGLGSDFQFVPAGLYLQDWNNNAQKTRGDDFYPLIPFNFYGVLNEFERTGINMFATVEDQIINSRKKGTGKVNFKFLQLDDLDQINVFLGPVTFIPPNDNGM